MIISTYGTLCRLLLLLVATITLTACGNNSGTFPQIASPPPFDYANGEELRSRMHQLAFELQQLDLSLSNEYDSSPNFQQEIVSSLQDIERIGNLLQTGDLSSRHPFLRDDMANFLTDVRRARENATSSQPRYYMAGRVSGACVNCHRSVR